MGYAGLRRVRTAEAVRWTAVRVLLQGYAGTACAPVKRTALNAPATAGPLRNAVMGNATPESEKTVLHVRPTAENVLWNMDAGMEDATPEKRFSAARRIAMTYAVTAYAVRMRIAGTVLRTVNAVSENIALPGKRDV